MSQSLWEQAVPVPPMPWDELVRWSERIRKMAHDLNNALVPAFAQVDLLRLKLGPTADNKLLRMMPSQLELARKTAHEAASWVVRAPLPNGPTWRSVRSDLTLLAAQAKATLVWSPEDDTETARAAWTTSDARYVLRAFVRNACDAIADQTDRQIFVTVTFDDSHGLFSVRDRGPGCEDLAAAVSGGSPRHGKGHLGLGLTAAATVAARSNAQVRIASPSPDGFVAMVRVPTRIDSEA
ncbi:MAG: HAMP domain-containing histidine kinase [Myxococcales bacterium]|nr:HAMP domain-containing histidine kinase [Myxococcales bacterium]